jgi:copper homeostasis protein
LTVVEAAVETFDSALASERGGVDRIELCASLSEGGTTPGAELIAAATQRLRLPVFVMIRSRAGGFVYSDDEVEIMTGDIETASGLGAAGIVVGALTPDHRIDVERTRAFVEAAGELPVTFHRAFDLTARPADALDELIEIGVSRILTSGSAATALEGADVIAALVDQAGDRISIMAGGGIREHNVREIIARTHVSEVHTRFLEETGIRRLVDLVGGRIQFG